MLTAFLRTPIGIIIVAILFIVLILGFGWMAGARSVLEQGRSVDVQMYVMAVDQGANLEHYRIEQAGDQFTYALSENTLFAIQQSPNIVECNNGLAISAVWTEFAQNVTCDGPAIHVVLIAP